MAPTGEALHASAQGRTICPRGGSAAARGARLADIDTQLIASGISEPLFLSQPAGDGRLFVTQRGGQIRVIDGGVLQTANYLSISGDVTTAGEGGLLGLAFTPNFATSGVMYVNYTTPSAAAGGMDTVIERITVATPGDPTAGSLTRQTSASLRPAVHQP